MKKLGLFAALFALLFAVNSYACDEEKKDGSKDKAPQAQTGTGAPAPAPQAGK